jgi:hypothetical protein
MGVRLLGLLRLLVVVHRALYFSSGSSRSRVRSSENINGSVLLELSGQDDEIWIGWVGWR